MYIDRTFADHYQFYVYDSEHDHYSDKELDWQTSEKKEYGYLAVEKAIYVSTVASLNDHRVRVFVEDYPKEKYERQFKWKLDLPSGKLVLSAPANSEEDDVFIEVEPGRYQVFVCSNSIGKDMFSYEHEYDEEMGDEEYFKHDEFEYYDIYVSKAT